jgi:uncharacterized membrane protein
MENIQAILADLERRVRELEARTAEGLPPARENTLRAHEVSPPPLPAHPSGPQAEPAGDPSGGPKKTSGAKPEAGTVFGILGVSFLVLAAVFFLKLTIESGWLTPGRQVLLASFFGVACLGLPHFIRQLADNYGALLSGSGVAILHLCWFGAYRVHHLMDSRTGLLLATAVGTLSVLTNLRFANAVFVGTAVAGTYLAVPLLGFRTDDLRAVSGFLLIWNLSYSLLSFLLKRRDVLLISSYFAIFTIGILSLECAENAEKAWQCLGIQGVQFLVFAAATLAFSVFHKSPLLAAEAAPAGLLLLAYYGNLYFLLDILTPAGAPWIAAAFSLSVLGLYQMVKSVLKREIPSAPVVLTFSALTLAHSVFFGMTPDAAKPLLALGIAGGLLLAKWRGTDSVHWKWPRRVCLALIAYAALLTFMLDAGVETLLAYNCLYGAGALAVLALGWIPQASGASLVLGFAHLEMLCALYRISLQVPSGGSLFVSCAWGLYALSILLWARSKKDRGLGRSAVLILVAVSLKAAFYDLAATSGMVRILSLLSAGTMLYACGWIYTRMNKWDASPPEGN